MKDLTRSYVDCICELTPGFYLGENDEIGVHGTPSFWAAKVAPKDILLEKAKSLDKEWQDAFKENPGFPRIFTCTVSRTIHNYLKDEEE